jgi:hypothetical protein
MAVVLPVKGSLNWDISLNAALTQLDNNNTSTIAGALQRANNLSDLTNVPLAVSHLGISAGAAAGVNQYNVKDYLAVGNGVVDDTAAIQAAINAAVNGGTVFFPPGNYLLNSSQLTVPNVGTVLRGSGAENAKLTIGSSFTGAYAIQITASTCEVVDLTIQGNNATTTSNPIANAVEVTAVRRSKITRCVFWFINGWAIEVTAGGSSSNNPDATMITDVIIRSSAGGIRFLGNTASGFAVNSFVSNIQYISGGVTTGASANLDGLRIEDAWDILATNLFLWTSLGTGVGLHIKGNCAASFIKNLDALGPNTGNNVLIEDSANGSPQNVQIDGGVIQQGLIGVRITGAAVNIHLSTLRFINNQTHGISVEGTGAPVHLNDLFFSTSGQGATGSNYDINWSGTSTGYVDDCRFASPIVTIGTPGVQQTVNISAAQAVRFINASFQGTGSTSANWFTATPSAVLETSAGNFNFVTSVTLGNTGTAASAKGNIAAQPSASGNTILSSNVNSADAFDRFRLLGDGSFTVGSGAAARDVTVGRTAANQLGLTTTDLAIVTAGRGVKIAEGTNAKMGTSVLVAGTVTVATTAVTANSRIYLTPQITGGTAGFLNIGTITAGTSFVIHSSNAADTSTVAWLIVDHT